MSDAHDKGLANERTALAWQRTALSLVVGAAVLARLTVDRLGLTAITLLGAAGVLSAWVFVESSWRYSQQHGHRQRRRPRGGRAAAFLSLAGALLAITEGIALLLR